jgi:hypothetical protein
MATTTITVREIRPPKPNGKKYVIVDERGDFYYIWPNQAGDYQIGHTYDIDYSAQDFRGNTIRSVESSKPSSAPPQRAVPQQAPRPNGSGGQGVSGGGYNTYRETSAADKLSMFVTAIVKAGVQSGQVQFNDESIAIAIQQAVIGYRDGWTTANQQAQPRQQQQAPAPQQQARTYNQDDPGDQIPF